MSFFEQFFDITNSERDTAVCCPFDHTTSGGISYKEHNPSAHVNTIEGLFHCKACGRGYNETQFIMQVLDCSLKHALELQHIYKSTESLADWKIEAPVKDDTLTLAKQLGIHSTIVEELHLSSSDSHSIMFPVFMYDQLLDIRKYTPGGKPKVKSRTGSPAGLIIPYDLWRETPKNKTTIICAGEKDMAIARSAGFNAITITGGESAVPITLKEFNDRPVVICYDNDNAGKTGAIKLAAYLAPHAKNVKNCIKFHEICKEDKEDITDFFIKYRKTKQDLIRCMEQTSLFEPSIEQTDVTLPIIDLCTATSEKYINKLVRSNIQIVTVSEATFVVPDTIVGEKKSDAGDSTSSMYPGEVKTWELCTEKIQDILHLIDGNFTEAQILEHCRGLLHILQKERNVAIRKYNKIPVFKCGVTDMFETADQDTAPMEYTAYSVGTKLDSGKKYLATYKLVPHPYKGQQLIMLITNATAANDTVTKFKITDEVKQNLNVIKNLNGSVPERIQQITDSIKGLLGYNGNDTLITAIDLTYHTVLNFNFGRFKNERGYLDTFVVGESRVGKSSTANTLRQTYQLGVFTSLAGASATISGLIGGSNKLNGNFQTRAGLIPQNHKGLIIFEEFGKSQHNIIAELTDIRSSNEVRITRVSGTLTLPATVRMLTLTNTKTTEGVPKPIASYPNGIEIITELIGSAEDIARYDLIIILGDKGATEIDPLWEPVTPFSTSVYQTKVRWVWSRQAEQVIIPRDVINYIIQKANEQNEKYNCHIKIFGTEAWKKISRLAIAVAGYLVSTDDTYENIIVQQEHVDYAVAFMETLYNNDTFRLKEYVINERKYSTIDKDGIDALQDLYIEAPALLMQLEQSSSTTKNTLQAATGLDNDSYNRVMNKLIMGAFVKYLKYDIVPTERFRIGMHRINRHVHAPKVGDVSATV